MDSGNREMVTENEAEGVLARFQQLSKYMDPILALAKTGDRTVEQRGVGTAVHVHWHGRPLTITCSHVAVPDCFYVTGPARVAKPVVPDSLPPPIVSIELLDRRKEIDAAVLDGAKLSKQAEQLYDLGRSEILSRERLLEFGKENAYVYGTWARESIAFGFGDGILYTELITYAARGYFTEIADNLILGSFTEADALPIPASKIGRTAPEPTGGSRDISGCSGCGLWVYIEDEPLLAGIMLGPEEASSTAHTIKFTPVWELIKFVGNCK